MKFVFKSADDLEEKVQGERPPGLYDHGMIQIGNYICLFGGRTFD